MRNSLFCQPEMGSDKEFPNKVTVFYRYLDVLLLFSLRILRFCAQNISGRFLKQIVSKLNHAQIEMYFRSDFCNYTQFSLLNTVLYLT